MFHLFVDHFFNVDFAVNEGFVVHKKIAELRLREFEGFAVWLLFLKDL